MFFYTFVTATGVVASTVGLFLIASLCSITIEALHKSERKEELNETTSLMYHSMQP